MSQNYQGHLCTYAKGIEYVGTGLIQVRKKKYRTCAHILRELNM